MSGSNRGAWAGLTFLLGFGAAIWLSGAALGELRGPRADLMRELNDLRAAAGVRALRSDRHLGQVAQQHAQSLARGSSVARTRTAVDLERSARSRGWRGSAPLVLLRLGGCDPTTALAGAAAQELLDPARAHAGVGVAPAAGGECFSVVVLDSPAR